MDRVEILQLLPFVVRQTWKQGALLDRLLSVMTDMLDPVEDTFEHLGDQINPRSARDDFARTLARWVLPDFSINLSLGRLRELVASAAHQTHWRGTRQGLVGFLEAATGVEGFSIDDGIPHKPFHMAVTVPGQAKKQLPLIKQLVEREKPAYLTWELVLD